MNRQIRFWPDQASTFSVDVDAYYLFLVAISLFCTALIAAGVIYLAVRYRRKTKLEKGADLHGNNMLEVAWTIIPLILSMIMFFWATHIFFKYAKPPADALEILVTGKQWMWKLQHSNGKREINELHVPVGQAVKLTLTSEDVIHSFYIPAFRIKMDVVPGRYTSTWFEPIKTGRYHLFCAEYCGTQHSEMGGSVYVMEAAEYARWLSGGVAQESPTEAGERLFTDLGCVTCHNNKSSARGPDLAGVFGGEEKMRDGTKRVVDEAYLRESILTPQENIVDGYTAIMPTFKGLVSETQLMQIIAYIKSLAGDSSGTDG